MASKKIIGIDLGTTNSCVAVVEGSNPQVIVNSEGFRTTPSAVGFAGEEKKVGDAAKRQMVVNGKNTISSVKRFIGQSYEDIKAHANDYSYEVKEGKNGLAVVVADGKEYTPQEISAIVLQKMKKTAEDYLGEEVTEAVITVPAYFNDAQRKATKEAGEIAGLNVRRIINEPTAAALAFGLDKQDKDFKIIVLDIGGGTTDVSILELGSGVFEVLATGGDTFLGGNDIDKKVEEWIIEEGKKELGVNLSKDTMALQRIQESAEKAKIELSNATSTEINLPYITSVDGTPKHLVLTLNRAKFEQLITPFVDKCMNIAKSVLSDANIGASQIDEILMVGGTTRVPLIRQKVKEVFGKEGNYSVNPDEAVALGAAIQGSVLAGENTDIILLDVTPLNLNITTMGRAATVMIPANTTIPVSKSETFSTAVDNQPAVDIEVTQGNRQLAADNKMLGMFVLDGITPAPRGVPQIEVTFSLDQNGILSVSAKDKATGKEQHIAIAASSGLTDEDIKKMKEDAELNAEADKKKIEKINLYNSVDGLIYSTEKSLKEFDEKVSAEEKEKVNEAIDSLKAVYNVDEASRDDEAIKAAVEKLSEVWGPIVQRIYSESSQSPETGNTTGPEVTEVPSEEV